MTCLVWLMGLGMASSSFLVFCTSGLALAHPLYSEYVSSDPAANMQLRRAPQTVTVHFSEYLAARKSILIITNAAGKRVSSTLVQPLPVKVQTLQTALRDTGSEVYIVNWYTVSAKDGSHDGGSFRFFVHASAPLQRSLKAYAPSLLPYHPTISSTSSPHELATIPLWLAGCIGLAGLITGIAIIWIFSRQAFYRRAMGILPDASDEDEYISHYD
ncbi:copper resistance CopC family protein [Dictyobacter arantiisoli]|uniref:CopC domain-containing protein n=1 Tax=Dictyobacter arantiisoli TaxID=2014874 RepID=A0A5A5TEV8_9CHLR|nr:copper resistance CopC family protein [Dictyobacter arantiisoli]GCF09444.1 hypothetical protein KDI_30080 [Dictyobacter arantiisoli]